MVSFCYLEPTRMRSPEGLRELIPAPLELEFSVLSFLKEPYDKFRAMIHRYSELVFESFVPQKRWANHEHLLIYQ